MNSSELNSGGKYAKHEFDLLASSVPRFVNVRIAHLKDAEHLAGFVQDHFESEEDDLELISQFISNNVDGVFLFEKSGSIVGFFAMQMLNSLGLKALLLGDYDGAKPILKYLTKGEVAPAGLYIWSCVAPGLAANGVKFVSHFLQKNNCKNINFYCRPVTDEGFELIQNFGFEPVEKNKIGMFSYTRLNNRLSN